MKDEKELTKSEIDFNNLVNEKHLTVRGNLNILQLNKLLGFPLAVMKYAKVEAKFNSIGTPFIVVERYIDGELRYSKDLVIRNISKSYIKKMECSEISTEYIRKDDYNPAKPPKATKKEIKDWMAKQSKES